MPVLDPEGVRRRDVEGVSERTVGERDLRVPSGFASGETEEAVIVKESSEIPMLRLPWIGISGSVSGVICGMTRAAAEALLLLTTLPLP